MRIRTEQRRESSLAHLKASHVPFMQVVDHTIVKVLEEASSGGSRKAGRRLWPVEASLSTVISEA